MWIALYEFIFYQRNALLGSVWLLGIVLGILWVIVWKSMPSSWLCDYGEVAQVCHKTSRMPKRWIVPVIGMISFLSLLLWLGGKHEDLFSFVLQLCLLWILLQIAVADWRFHIIPDQWILGIVLLALIQMMKVGDIKIAVQNLLSAFCIVIFIWAMAGLLSLILKQEVLGFGDVKLFFALSLYFGFWNVMWVFALAVIFCGMGCAILLLAKVYQKDSICAFGPYIAVASIYFLMQAK